MYVIEVMVNDCVSAYKYYGNTLEECLNEIRRDPIRYTDWYSPTGDCTIIEIDKHFNKLKTYWVRKGIAKEI